MESMEVLDVEPLCMIPPKGSSSSSGDLSDVVSPKVSASPDNSANGLPPGWTVISRTKGNGHTYKVYIESHTGRKFYSRVKVLEYLQNLASSNPDQRVQSRRANRICSQRLPPDFVVQIKTKMSGKGAGSEYKVYIEKSTGKKFYSKSQVFDYLRLHSRSSSNIHGVRSENPHEWFPECHSMKAEIESDDSDSTYDRKYKAKDTEIVETNVEGLPMGWFKAIRYGESIAVIHKKTALYVDPVSGYAFFSRKDALRYIDNGHVEDCRVKPTLWSEISKKCAGNKFHSQPTSKEREVKPERRKGKRPLYTKESDEGISEEDVIQIDDSDGHCEPTTEERLKRNEENFRKKPYDGVETDDTPMGADKANTAEKGEEKMTETPPLGRIRTKVLASKKRPFLGSCKSTSSPTHTSDPSSVCPEQTNLKTNEENRTSEQNEVPNEGSSQQVDQQEIRSDRTEASPSATLGKPSLDPSLKFAF